MNDQKHQSSATIADVAALAGVSRQTVSNVFNAPQRVAPATTDRVHAAIRKLEYRQNRAARNLRVRASHTIGLRINPLMGLGDLLDRFLHALAESAQTAGYHVLLFTSADPETEIATYDDLIQTGTVDGFVLTDIGAADPRPTWFTKRRIPFVCFGRPREHRTECAWVDVDGAYGTAQAVDYLVARGHRRIAYLGWPRGTGYGDDRQAGWRRAMRRHRLSIAGLTGTCTHDAGAAAAAVGRLLAGSNAPTAFVCGSDTFAIGARLGCGVDAAGHPRAAVVGFDDSPAATFLSPPLSSVRQPLPEVARHVVELLIRRIADPDTQPENFLLRPELICRD